MEIKIGIQSVPREIVLETASSAQEVEHALNEAIADGTVLVLRDEKGGKIIVPASKIAYLELSNSEPRRVGFGNL